jgi:hypothetical protein
VQHFAKQDDIRTARPFVAPGVAVAAPISITTSARDARVAPPGARILRRAGRPRGRSLPTILAGAFVAFAILLFADRIIAGLVAANMGALPQ